LDGRSGLGKGRYGRLSEGWKRWFRCRRNLAFLFLPVMQGVDFCLVETILTLFPDFDLALLSMHKLPVLAMTRRTQIDA
jgi:hypothetical protein